MEGAKRVSTFLYHDAETFLELSTRRRYSYEYTLLRILEYLVLKKASYPISKHHILTRVSSATQRQDRITSIMTQLVDRGWVDVLRTERASYYRITPEGEAVYARWVKEFLAFARTIYHESSPEVFSSTRS
jgi:DNA-binding PadR family transcriptional regulator